MVSVRTVMVISALVALISGAAIFGGLLPLDLRGTSNTSSEFFSIFGIQGEGAVRLDGDRELLTRTQYVTSWASDGLSQEFSAEGGIRWTVAFTNVVAVELLDGHYQWTAFDASGNIIDSRFRALDVTFPFRLQLGQKHFMGFDSWTLLGPVVGVVQFEFIASYSLCIARISGSGCDWNDQPATSLPWASDRALLVSGIGAVSIGSPQPVGIGDNVLINYNLGVATDEGGVGGWQLQLLKPRDQGGSIVKTWTHSQLGGDFASGQVSHLVTASMFQLGTSNEYQVILLNQIIKQDMTIFVTIDEPELAPGTPSISWLPGGVPLLGDTITLFFVSNPNPFTMNAIVSYNVHLSYFGGSTTQITVHAEEFTFTIGESSNLKVIVTAFDGQRTSAPAEVILQIDPNQPFDPEPPSQSNILLFVFLISLGIMLALVIWFFVPLGPRLKMIIILGMVVALVVGGNFLLTGKVGF